MRTQFNVEAMGNPAGNQTQTTQLFLEFITDQSGFMSRYVTGTQIVVDGGLTASTG